jgi:transposase
VQNATLWRALLGVERTVVEDIEFDEDEQLLVAQVRPRKRARGRCGRCGRRSPGYDAGEGRRRWRALDLGTVQVMLEAAAPRVNCPDHGPTVAAVPWARHAAGHTYAFDDQVAWLAVACSKSAVTQLMRVAWRTVGAIVKRVCDDVDASVDRYAGLRRIGIDEVSYKKRHKYLTVVVDHDSRRLVWAAPGQDAATLRRFFDALGPERAQALTHVSCDGASWITKVLAERCPRAEQCADPFHVVAWATEALDEVRRAAWNDARRKPGGTVTESHIGRERRISQGEARTLARSRWARWKNPEDLTDNQRLKLEWIAKTDPRLHRAYLLKEGLRHVFKLAGQAAKEALDRWISWARRCQIPQFVELQRRITRHRRMIDASLDHGLSNGLIEATNTKIRLITRVAFGFKDPHALIALIMLSLGGYRPALPGRN